ncbi:hypothetical protein TRFO_13665 [Tritrichomonas foetus]|uniref:Uncharacterized protein n=1 Tax=Tritrichomonas foetus TaxID=1144522 RepID=A0A1J4KY90_9EUKA|nr:hypothetical protein TRFO_13665 [Tritrichomonas foetus]|eukprot:OHT15848.1 hypothetical protein TRFO_13665 [Tritrichomonas foetus]
MNHNNQFALLYEEPEQYVKVKCQSNKPEKFTHIEERVAEDGSKIREEREYVYESSFFKEEEEWILGPVGKGKENIENFVTEFNNSKESRIENIERSHAHEGYLRKCEYI